MNTTPEEFQRRLAESKKHAAFQLLFVLAQTAAVFSCLRSPTTPSFAC